MTAAVATAPGLTLGSVPTPVLPTDVDTPLETFTIPHARTVHGQEFPLGVRVKKGAKIDDADSAARHIEALADRGVFDQLLVNRELYTAPTSAPGMVLFSSLFCCVHCS